MSIKTAHQLDVRRLAFSLVATLVLPSCSEAEQSDSRQQAVSDPVQLAQAQPGAATSGTGGGGSKPTSSS